jgi:hypothetical protein
MKNQKKRRKVTKSTAGKYFSFEKSQTSKKEKKKSFPLLILFFSSPFSPTHKIVFTLHFILLNFESVFFSSSIILSIFAIFRVFSFDILSILSIQFLLRKERREEFSFNVRPRELTKNRNDDRQKITHNELWGRWNNDNNNNNNRTESVSCRV